MKRKRETRSTAPPAAAAQAVEFAAELDPANNFPDSNSMVDTDAAAAAATVAAAVATASHISMEMTRPCIPSQVNSTGPEYVMRPSLGHSQPLNAKDMDVISMKQEELHMFLDSIPDFRNAVMVRGGRCIKSHFVHVVKGDNYLKDMFYTTESTPQRRIVLARETLYCRGRGNCLRACGGRGACMAGCPKISDRASGGHYCHFQVKLFMLSTSVGTWQVRIIGSHDGPTTSWFPETDLPPLDKACQPNNVEPELLEIEPLTDPDQVWNQNTDLNDIGVQQPVLDYSIGIGADPSITQSVQQENLREYLDGIPAYYDAIMVRGGRFIKGEYITVEKGNHYMKDKFFLKPDAPGKNVQVARETLFCSGRGNCIRRCGGIGACIKGCSRTSERASGGHACYFQVKLAMYASAVGVWQVRVQDSHNGPVEPWDKSMCRPDMMGPGLDADLLDPSVSLPGDNCIVGDISGGDIIHPDEIKVEIPVQELHFIHIQLEKTGTTSSYQIDNTDVVESPKISKSYKWRSQESTSEEKRVQAAVGDGLSSRVELISPNSEEEDDGNGIGGEDSSSMKFYHKLTGQEVQPNTQNQIHFKNLAQQSIRFGVSVRATTALATATLIDAGVTEEDASKVVCKTRIQQEINHYLKEFQMHSQSQGMLPSGDGKSPMLCACPCDGSCQTELENLRQENTSLKLEMLRLRHNMSAETRHNSAPTNDDNGLVNSRGDPFKLVEELKELIKKYDKSSSEFSPSSPSKEPAMYLMKMR